MRAPYFTTAQLAALTPRTGAALLVLLVHYH